MEPLQRDPQLWQKAKARAKFQSHFVVYVLVNAGLWLIWALTDHRHEGQVPWPLWATAFWGLALLLRGVATYGGFNHRQRTQREYERLVRAQENGNLPR